MRKMKHVVLLIASLVGTILSTSGIVLAAGFNQFVVFGDSTLDTGYFRYNTTGNPILNQVILMPSLTVILVGGQVMVS